MCMSLEFLKPGSDENAFSAAALSAVQGMSLLELQKEVLDSREKLKAIT